MATSALIARPGHGKSFVLTSIARHHLRRGRRVFSNFHIDGAELYTLEDIPHLPPGVVLMDEAASWFHSRNWARMSDAMLSKWNQTRKAGWDLFVATQHEANLDAVIRRNVQWGWLLEARWSVLTALDPRVRALARMKTAEARAVFAELQERGTFPPNTKPPKVSPIEVAHPLYVYGRMWDFEYFRSTRKNQRPVARRRWWWSWDTALAYDTEETLEHAPAQPATATRRRAG